MRRKDQRYLLQEKVNLLSGECTHQSRLPGLWPKSSSRVLIENQPFDLIARERMILHVDQLEEKECSWKNRRRSDTMRFETGMEGHIQVKTMARLHGNSKLRVDMHGRQGKDGRVWKVLSTFGPSVEGSFCVDTICRVDPWSTLEPKVIVFLVKNGESFIITSSYPTRVSNQF